MAKVTSGSTAPFTQTSFSANPAVLSTITGGGTVGKPIKPVRPTSATLRSKAPAPRVVGAPGIGTI